jgi:hypothetical protein
MMHHEMGVRDIGCPSPLTLWASQARHESGAREETFAARIVVPLVPHGARKKKGCEAETREAI